MVERINIIKDLFINACILIFITFIAIQVFKNHSQIKITKKILIGFIGGMLGIILMFYSMHITSNLILDFRHISEIVVVIYGGLISLSITAVISALFRLIYFGVSIYSVVTSLGIIIVSVGYAFISKLSISKKQKWVYMLLYSVIVRSVILSSLLNNKSLIEAALLPLWLGTLVVGSTVYFLVQYLETANKALKKVRDEAEKDSLTGLNNRKNFKKLLNEAIENTVQKKEPISVLVVDIDFFKKVNVTYGRLAGNSILKALAQILCGACSKFDIVGRIGGEKFSIVIPKCSNVRAIEIAERIRAVVEKYPFVLPDGKIIYSTVSIGVATYPDTTLELESILKKADMALYDAKHTGRNKVSYIIKD